MKQLELYNGLLSIDVGYMNYCNPYTMLTIVAMMTGIVLNIAVNNYRIPLTTMYSIIFE